MFRNVVQGGVQMTKYLEIKQFMLKDLTCMFNAMFRDLTAEIESL